MMKLSLMKNVFETVNSDWDCNLANELIKVWEHENNWVKMWRASANFICFFRNNNEHYVARFNRDSEKNINDLKAEIELLNYLISQKVRIAKPIISKNEVFINETETIYGIFYTMVFERIFGEQKELDKLSLVEFYEWGESLGKLHEAIKNIPNALKIKRKTHRELLEELITTIPINDNVEQKEYQRIDKWLKTLPINKKNYGIVHYDFEIDNLIWNNDGITIIDFDDSIYSWFIADIAHALKELIYKNGRYNNQDERYIKFIDGYKKMTDLSDEEIFQIPNFLKLHDFISYKKLQRSLDLKVNNRNPQWMNDLIIKLKSEFLEQYYNHFQQI